MYHSAIYMQKLQLVTTNPINVTISINNKASAHMVRLLGLRSLGLCQSTAVINHSECSGTLHRIPNESVPTVQLPIATV